MGAEHFLCWALGGLFGAMVGHMATIKDLRNMGFRVPGWLPWDREAR